MAPRPVLGGRRQTLPKTTVNQGSTEDPQERGVDQSTPPSTCLWIDVHKKWECSVRGPQTGSPKMPPTYNASFKKAIHDQNPTEPVITRLGGSKPHKSLTRGEDCIAVEILFPKSHCSVRPGHVILPPPPHPMSHSCSRAGGGGISRLPFSKTLSSFKTKINAGNKYEKCIFKNKSIC